jgi:multicomponent Na+:H+ antiporter subunit C
VTAVGPLLARLPYVVAVLLVGVGLFVLLVDTNLVRKVMGLNVFQTGIFLFFVAAGVRTGGRSPLVAGPGPYVNPLPHVLILTAIVVGVSVTAVALALVVRISRERRDGAGGLGGGGGRE